MTNYNFLPWNQPQNKEVGPPTFVEQFVHTLDEPRLQREALANALRTKEQAIAAQVDVDQIVGTILLAADMVYKEAALSSQLTLTPLQYQQCQKARAAMAESKLIVKERFCVTRETSYAQLEQAQALASKANRLMALADAYPALSANILSSDRITDKAQALKALADELSERVRQEEQVATKDRKPWELLVTSSGEQVWHRS